MVTMVDLAVIAARYDTVVAAAFRRALVGAGIPVALPPARPGVVRGRRSARAGDLAWCFANHGNPMDLIR